MIAPMGGIKDHSAAVELWCSRCGRNVTELKFGDECLGCRSVISPTSVAYRKRRLPRWRQILRTTRVFLICGAITALMWSCNRVDSFEELSPSARSRLMGFGVLGPFAHVGARSIVSAVAQPAVLLTVAMLAQLVFRWTRFARFMLWVVVVSWFHVGCSARSILIIW
jgi:hypothetical protein